MALVTAEPPPPAALAPLLQGLLSVSKLSLGSGTAKSQRSGRCLPQPFPQRQPALGGRKERGTGDSNSGVQASQGPFAKEKRHAIRGRNGAFNGHTQPVSRFPGKNQTSVEIPHTLTSPFWFLLDRSGGWAPGKNRGVSSSPSLTQLTPGTVVTWPAQGLLVATMMHSGTLVMSASQDGGDHSAQWASVTITSKGSAKGTCITAPKGPTKMSSQMVAIRTPNRSTSNINQHGSLHSTQRAHQDVNGSHHSSQWINTMPTEMAVTAVSNRPARM